MKKVKATIVGCGNIAETYAKQIASYASIELAGFCDLAPERATAFATAHGGRAYGSLDEVLADPSVAIVVNLTIHHAHAEVIRASLQAGKHVYSEKPLATSSEDARALVALAGSAGLRLGSAPATFLGEAAQAVGRGLRDGRAGKLRLAYAEINHGRIETWHPNPAPFYSVGPVWDVAVYPLGIWAALCGPMRKVTAFGRTLLPTRQALDGSEFPVTVPDFMTAAVEFESGLIGRLTSNFYVNPSRQGASMEFHGDAGSFYLGSSYLFDAPVEFAPFGKQFSPVAPAREPFQGVEFGRGLDDFARAIAEDRPHRCSGEMAAHLVEVMEGIHESAASGRSVAIGSGFSQPAPMDWA